MVESAVRHEEDLAARHLAVQDARDVDARLADQVAPEFEHDRRSGQVARRALAQPLQVVGDRRQVEPLLARKVRDAEAAAQVERSHGFGLARGQAQREFVGLELRLADRLGAQVLRAREKMEALELEAGRGDGVQHGGHELDVDAELLGAAAHLHAGPLQLEVRVHAHGHARDDAQLRADVLQQVDLAHGLEIEQHPRRDGLAQFRFALAGAREADLARIGPGVQRHLQLTSGGDVDAVDQLRHQTHHRRHRIGLHRVVQANAGGQRRAKLVDTPAQQGSVIREERRLADALGQRRQRLAADEQLAAGAGELRHRGVARRGGRDLLGIHQRLRHVGSAALPAWATHSVDNSLRSILPFGLRGSGPTRTAMPAGTM